jgi:hypothetical protein
MGRLAMLRQCGGWRCHGNGVIGSVTENGAAGDVTAVKKKLLRRDMLRRDRVSSFGGLIELVSERSSKNHAVRAMTEYLAAMRKDTAETKSAVSMCMISSGS